LNVAAHVRAGAFDASHRGNLTAMSVQSTPQADPSIGDLVNQLSAQTSRLVRDEMKLAQSEFRDAAKHAGLGAGLLSVAGLLSILGLATFVTSAVAALALVLPLWAAALVIGAVLFVAVGIAGLISKKQLQRTEPVPKQTVTSVKQDINEVKDARHDRS
jgi:Flp pilus assembly protein TadB